MKKILIIDDQELYLVSLEIALSDEFEVFTARSLSEAKELLDTRLNLALIDIRLDENDDQNRDGLILLEHIRKNFPQITPFVMSAYREFSYAEQALNLGARHFFQKPIDNLQLLAILREKG
jgi:DNA-binding NtrC family response regulator